MKQDVPISYRKSFMAKYIQSDDRCKEVYNTLKNKLMSIKGIKSRISWFYDAFNIGRINFAKISVRGKYVALYLNLDPLKYPSNIYHQEDVSDRRRFTDTRFKIHVKSDRTIKYAFKLIDDEIKLFNLKTINLPKENYYLNYESETPLVDRGLIKLESIQGEKQYHYSFKDIIEIEDRDIVDLEELKNNDKNLKKISFVDGSKVFVKERRSFQAKLIQSTKRTQNYYSTLKNEILSYTRVKSRVSWKYEAFSINKIKLAKMQIRGRYLVLYLALDPKKLEMKELQLEDATKYDLFKETPVMIRIKSDERLQTAITLIDQLERRFALNEGFIKENRDYDYNFEESNKLIDKGLIKVYKKFGDYSTQEEELFVNEVKSRKKNNFPVYKEEKHLVLSINENNDFVENYEIVKIPLEGERDIINLDVIERNFIDGDIVDLKALKKKGLMPNDIKFYKVVYRGGLFNRNLTIICQSIAPIAKKVIEDSGSTVIVKVED